MSRLRIGINGFGRMGSLALRAAWEWPELEIVHINELHGDAATGAHLLCFDSIHGRWRHDATGEDHQLVVGDRAISYTAAASAESLIWDVDVVLECTGRFRTVESLMPYLQRGARKVIVAAPVNDDRAINVVMGVNEDRYDPDRYDIVTAASCTTNCLAPVVKVLHEGLGIQRGSITTLHDLTNTQVVVDAHHKDLRRARAASLSLIPTTTGSASCCAPPPPVRWPGSLATKAGRWCRWTTRTILGRGSWTRFPRWSPTTPRSRCWPGMTTSGATQTG